MKIAVCDDSLQDLEAFTTLLSAYGKKTGAFLHMNTFSNADSLLHTLENGGQFDVIFLDIMMPGINGIEAARELRQSDNSTELIFLTSSRDFALDAFSVKAKDYLVKPLAEATLFCLLDDLTVKLDEDDSILIDSKKTLRKLHPDRIEYCEVKGHHVFWNLRSGVVLESRSSILETEKLLLRSGFFMKVHRSFIVNLHCVSSFNRDSCTIDLESLTRIPVPKAKFSAILQQYLEKIEGAQDK